MSIVIFSVIILWLLAGVAKGICDSIEFHDSYKDWGYDWSRDSWNNKYTHPNWLSRLLDASLNAWHILDWIRTGLQVVSLAIVSVYPLELVPILLYVPFAFVMGFLVSYR